MKKRIIAFTLCVLMAVTSVPLSPLAQFLVTEASAAGVLVESVEPFSTLTSGKLKMTSNTTETFKVMVQPLRAENKNIKWTSSDKSVVAVSDAQVSSSGIASVLLTAGKSGKAKITYTTTDGSNISGSFTVEVAPLVKKLELNQNVKSITLNSEGEKLIATVTPADAGNQKLMWFSSDESVCKVDYNGTLYPVSSGECYISVATTDGSDIVKTCRLIVGTKAASVELNKSSVKVANGKKVTLYATVTTVDGSKHDAVKWTTSDKKIATVSQDGVVTAKYPGKVKITATTTDGTKKSASCTVTVTQKITKISLPENVTVSVGKSKTVKATITPSYATDKTLKWSSSDKSIATVSSSGVVTGKKVGTVRITCESSDGKVYDTCLVKVAVPATSVTLNAETKEIRKGRTFQLKATIKPSEATDKSVTWTSSDTDVAKVNSKGLVTAVAGGSCTIRAKTSDGLVAYCEIRVIEGVSGVRFTTTSKTMYVGQSTELGYKVLPSTASNKKVTWSSSDTSVVKVSADGTVTARKAGTATVTVKTVDGGFKASCKITVNKKISVNGVKLDKKSLSLNVGKSYSLNATISPSNASEKKIKWTTSDKKVATVSSSGVIKAVSTGTVTITATTVDGEYTAKCKVTVKQPVTGISISASSAKIAVGTTKTLAWKITPSGASNKAVTWSSSNTSVATVSKGVITAKKTGTAIITVKTADGGYKATCMVTVYVPATSIKINSDSIDVPRGETRVLTATVYPSNASSTDIVWSSSDTKIATVNAVGRVTGVSKGTVIITAKTADGKYKAKCEVNVIQLVESVKLNAVSVSIQAGRTKTLSATISPLSATYKTVKWKSSDKKVATVSKDGVVTAVSGGTAIITATSADGNAEAKCRVNVIQAATAIKLNKEEAIIAVGSSGKLKATVTPADAVNKSVTWISSNTSVATVSSTGVVKGVSVGKVKITARTSDGAQSASCVVYVVKPVEGVSLDKRSITMQVGKSTTITPIFTPADATLKTVKWYSDNNDVATVDKNGKVTAKGQGHATITAKTVDGSFKATASVLVIEPVQSITLNKTASYLNVGSKLTLKPIFTPSDATIKSVTWSSSDSNIASVNSDGVVKGVKSGVAVITCTTNEGRKVATCKVYVVKRVSGIKLNYDSKILYFGEKLKLKATVYPADATVKDYVFTSTDPSVAKVSSKGVVTPVKVGTTEIIVTTKDGSHTAICKVSVKKAPEGIILGAKEATFVAGESKVLKYLIYPEDATNRKAKFSSSNTKVATVDKNGKITAVSRGTATITAMTENGIKAYCKITVEQPVTGIKLTSKATVYTGKTLQLSAKVIPSDAQNKSLKWKSSDTSVAKVSSKGVVTAVKAGTVKITVTSAVNSKIKATCVVTVKQHVTSISFAKSEINLNKGSSTVLKYTVRPSDATNKKVTFQSSDSKIVSVTKDGRIKALKGGSATITVISADSKKIKAVCKVNVVEPVTGVKLNRTSKTLYIGEKLTLKATVSPSDAFNKKGKWISSNGVVSVSSKGVVTAKKAGTATVTVKTVDGSFKATCKITVKKAPEKVVLDKEKTTLKVGQTYTLKYTVKPSDATNKSVTFKSSNSKVAKVNSKGIITAVGKGTATITVKAENGIKAIFKVTVKQPVEGIRLASKATVYTGKTVKPKVSVLPSDANNKNLKWSSSDSKIAKVSSSGVITGVKAGTVKITVRSAENSKIKATCVVTVKQHVTGLKFTKENITVKNGTVTKLSYVVYPSDATNKAVKFASSNTKVVKVSADGKITAVGKGTAAVIVTSKDNSELSAAITVKVINPVKGVKLNYSKKSLYIGDKLTLKATVSPSDAHNKNVKWSTSDSNIVSVSETGVVTAKKAGTATVTVKTVDGSFKASCKITVKKAPVKIELAMSEITLKLGESEIISYTVKPSDATNKAVSFKSSDTSVAKVSADGTITAISKGTAKITVTSKDKSDVKAVVTVNAVKAVDGVTLNRTSKTLYIGDKLTLKATVSPSDAHNKKVKWSTSSDVVSVSETGVVTALKAGTATVTVKTVDGSFKASCKITVKKAVEKIALEQSEIVLKLGESETIGYTVKPVDATNKAVSFTSSDTGIATVDANGVITAVSKGVAKITVTSKDNSDVKAVITVNAVKAVDGVTLNYTEKTVFVGDTLTLKATVSPEDAYDKAVECSTDSNNITVSETGVVTAKKAGTATVTVKTVDGSYEASCELTLLQRATSVKPAESEVTVIRGESYQLQAEVLPANCYDKSVKWTSADETIATVTADGLVTAVAPGEVVLICTSLESGVSATVTVRVHQLVTGIKLNKTETVLFTPFKEKLEVEVLPADASDKSVTWKSSDRNVVKVKADGTLVPVGKGEATVTVTSNDTGVAVSCTVAVFIGVEEITAESICTLNENTSTEITWNVLPENAENNSVTFTSSDENVFTVDENGKVTGVSKGTAELTITSVQNPKAKKTITVNVTRPVTGISIETQEKILYKGESFDPGIAVAPVDASNLTVNYTSSNPEVADVGSDGKINALKRGFAVITATTDDGGFAVECSIEVVQLPEEISCESDSATLYMGDTLTLNMTVLPEDTNDKTLTWKSSDENVATVDENGVVTSVATGSCYITASSITDGVEKSVKVTVVQLCQEIQITGRIPELFAEQKIRLIATVLPENTTEKGIDWISSDENVVTVDENGVVTAVAPGNATVTARSKDDGKAEASVEVKVVAPISGVRLNVSEKAINIGETFALVATVEPEAAYDKTVTFASSDENVATVDENGVVTAKSIGTAEITVTTADGNITATAVITVEKPGEEIVVYRDEFTLSVDSKVKVSYAVLPEDATVVELEWTSSDESVATVTQQGVVTAVGSGTAVITLNIKGTDVRNTVTVTVE